ncbi:MAG TPA: non-ribosomal peptide synthetase [Thermoanaerobaculia bacterium]
MAVTVVERFRDIVAQHGDTLALTSPRARYTYAQLDQWSNAIAADVFSRNLPRERPLAIVARDPVALVPAVLGVIKAAHFFVVVDAIEPEERRRAIIETANAIEIGQMGQMGPRLSHSSPSSDSSYPSHPPHEYIQLTFTSGTTGKPKGVATKQEGFVERLIAQSQLTGRAAGERVSYTALPGFARATYEIFGSLLNGATLCAFDARNESLDDLADFITRERLTVLTLTPALFRRFVRTAPPDVDLSSIRKLRIGADVITVADVELYKQRFPRGCTLERGFNSSETGMVMHMRIDHDTPIPGPLVPVGRPRPNVAVRLIDEEGNDVAEGETGELVVRGNYLTGGYWNDPALTAEKFRADGFHTGDLLRRDADGLYYFIGRKDARLKIHGRRVDPVEVESALIAHGHVREAVVAGEPNADGELQLVAYVVGDVEAREIRAALRDKLPPWMIPTRIHAVDSIPMTPAGKVDRKALQLARGTRAEHGQRTTDNGQHPFERTLLDIWSRVLETPVGLHDDYFNDLGGTSILAAHLVTEIRRATGRALPLSILLELNTVAKMADYLRAESDLERTAVIVQRGRDGVPPLFCVSGKGGSVINFRELAKLLGADQPFYGLTHHGFTTMPSTFAAVVACYADAIRSIQPEGPYRLAGYSAGGLIAYEIARHLTRSGAAVDFVGLIDTAAFPDRAPAWRRYTKRMTLIGERPLTMLPRYARAVATRAASLLKGRRWTPPPPPPETEEMNRILEELRKRENLHPYAGRVTLFLARHGWGTDAVTPDLGWRRLCENLEIIPVPGEHHSVIRDDVAALANAFRKALHGTGKR